MMRAGQARSARRVLAEEIGHTMGCEDFQVVLRARAEPGQVMAALRRLIDVGDDPSGGQSRGEVYLVHDDGRHVLQFALSAKAGSRISIRFALCNPESI